MQSDPIVVTPTGGALNITNFSLETDVIDLSAFIRSDVSEALQGATGTENAVLTFFDGTEITISGDDVTGETISQATFLVSGSNQSPQGEVVISGTAEVGSTLTVSIDAITDRDGVRDSTLSVQWLRDSVEIEGATSTEYVFTDDDVDTVLSVRVFYVDFFGRNEQITSAEFPASTGDNIDPGTDDDAGDSGDDDDAGQVEDPIEDEPDIPTIGDGVNDTPVEATGFPDVFAIRDGMNFVNGLDGFDTAVFTGDLSHYDIIETTSGAIVTDERADGHGRVVLVNVEALRFEEPDSRGVDFIDLRFASDDTGSNGQGRQTPVDMPEFSLSFDDAEDLIEMYIAYFNRAPDAAGFAFWGEAYAEGASIEDIAGMFVDQPETRALYPENENPAKLVAEVYDNVLGRAPDLEGLQFWVNAVRSGQVTQDELILEVVRGVDSEFDIRTPQALVDRQIADRQYLDMKTDLGFQFAVEHGLSNVADANTIMALFDGSADSFVTATAAVDTLYAEAIQPGSGEMVMPLIGVIDGFEVF